MRYGTNYKRSLTALLSLTLLLAVGFSGPYLPHRRQAFRKPAAAGGSFGLTSPDIDERFNATGYDVGGWSEQVGSGTIDKDYTTGAPEGAQCLRIVQGSFDATYIHRTLTANGSYLFYWQVKPVTIGGDDEMLTIWSGGGSSQEGKIILLGNGKLRVDLLDASPVDTVGALSTGTLYHIYVSYVNSGKTMTVAFSTDGSRPTGGNDHASDTAASDSDAIDKVGHFGHNAFNAASESLFDVFQAKQGTTW